MFGKDFYPTPQNVIDLMIYGQNIENKIVLEPSAGKGNIVDYLFSSGAKDVLACEINKDLQNILTTKCKVIAEDFLTVTSDQISHIDTIVMNPPFSADDKHILHAYNIAPDGCEIIALCNWETYRNDYSRTRQQLKAIIRDYGNIEPLGNCFDTAERQTDAEVGLIKIQKPGTAKNEWEGFYLDEEPEQEQYKGIMTYNFARDLVNRYISAVKLYDELLILGTRMHNLTESFYSSNLSFSCTVDGAPKLREDFKKDLQKSAWNWVFNKMNMGKFTTKGLRDDINKFVERQTRVPFTMKNIYKMIEIVIGTHSQRMDRAIIEVFDNLTKHYHDNRYCVEGWKTNSHYFMGEKFILPGMTSTFLSRGTVELSSYDRCIELVEDMVKALCYLTGYDYDKIIPLRCFILNFYKLKDANGNFLTGYDNYFRSYERAEFRKKELGKGGIETTIHCQECEWGKWYDWYFFEIKGYKKGTMHFKFKNRDHWAIFNQNVARIKGYPLPEAIKK